MSEKKTYSPTYIDNRPYAVTVPTEEQWNTVMALYEGRDDDFLHHKDMFSWTQDMFKGLPNKRVTVGYHSYGSVFFSDIAKEHLGYRPVLIPLNPDTLRPDTTHIDGITDGVVIKMGTLYMAGKRVTTMYPGANYAENTPDYVSQSLLQLGDSALDIYSQINFIKCGDFLIADRNILRNISWEDLDKCGLVYGNGISDPSLFFKKPGLDELIHDALKESQNQVSQRLGSEMEQAIKENIKKRLGSNYER